MKKLLAVLLALAMIFAFAACGEKKEEEKEFDPSAKSEGALTYAEYVAAEEGKTVTVEGYVQAAQSYWKGATLYLADGDGAYFVYCSGKEEEADISEEDYAKLVSSTTYGEGWTGIANGTHVSVTGTKTSWAGEVEISDAKVTILDDTTWTAEATDVTAILAEEELQAHNNQLVSITGLTVVEYTEGENNAFVYKNGAAGNNDDLYFKVSLNGNVYEFCVESYLTYEGSEVYKAVESLKVGDIIDLQGFLYWYNGANVQATSVTVKFSPSAKSEGALSYAEYVATEEGQTVTVEGYVQAAQSYWKGATLYLADGNGAYFVYCSGSEEEANISEEDYAKLVSSTTYGNGWTGIANGTHVSVTGTKTSWAGEVEIADAKVTVLDDTTWTAAATDVTAILADETRLQAHNNQLVSVSGLTVAEYTEGQNNAFVYKNGAAGNNDDLYFKVSLDGNVYEFCVESYLTYEGSEVYKAVESLKVGDTIDLQGFLYWYNGANIQATSVTVK